jgi:hypothetical protein
MAKHVFIVLTNPTEGEGDEATFNDWYTNQHLSDILTIPGFVRAQRFAASDAQLGDGALPYKYLAIYEVDSDNVEEAARAMQQAAGTLYISPALDLSRAGAWFFTPIPGAVREKTPANEATA